MAIGHRLAVAPCRYARRPALQRRPAVGAAIELGRAVQADVDEVRGQIHQQRPLDRIGADQRDVVLAQQRDERRIAEALVADLDGMADRPAPVGAQPRPALQPMIMPAAANGGLLGVARQQLEEGLELLEG